MADPAPGNEAELLQQALAFHQSGQLGQAQVLYQNILTANPNHVDGLHLLGVLASQLSDHQSAVDLIGRAIALRPGDASFYYNRAIAHKELRQLSAAVADYDNAIALGANSAVANYQRGLLLQELKQPQAALASFDQAIALDPHNGEVYYSRGIALQALHQQEAAIISYNHVVALIPDFAEAYYNCGVVQQELKQIEAALASYELAIPLLPDPTAAYYNKGIVLKELKRPQAAVDSYEQAIALTPDYPEAYSNRGIALHDLGQMNAAIDSYDKAIALRPHYAEAFYNRGNSLKAMRRFDAAIASYDQAIALQPDYIDAHWNKSWALLLKGDFAQGWASYECRWQRESVKLFQRNLPQPLWLGAESLEGKTILLHSEQGFGDTIQFCRYAKLVAARGARVILEVEKPLMRLLQGLEGVSTLIEKDSAPPAFDFHCPLLSLPLAFNTDISSIPHSARYLHSDNSKIAHWSTRLGARTKPRIGIVWTGASLNPNDANRSIRLAEYIKYLPQDIEYVSLQQEVRTIDNATLAANPNIRHFGHELADFTDTAALCELMDVVISVDTSVAHLSSALGKPTWILLPQDPDWRWLTDRADSPWYPGVRLYRQEVAGDWNPVLASVVTDLIKAFRLPA